MEYWRDIPEYPEYQASIDGEIRNKITGKILKGNWRNPKGNMPSHRYKVRRSDGVWMAKTGASLVYAAFYGIPEKCVWHKNGITTDDRPCNLQEGGGGLYNYSSIEKKPVVVMDRFGNFLRRYNSVRSAERGEGITRKTISSLCKGITGPMAENGLFYKFEEDIEV